MTGRALITGVTGFIGGKLAARLISDGWQVDAIVRPSSDTASLLFADEVILHTREDGQDLTPVLTAAKPDIVFHLASLYLAEHRPDQIGGLVQSNVLFPTLLAEAMATTGVRRLINTGTAWQHFEGAAQRPANLYAATKQAFEALLDYYVDAKGLMVTTLKLYDTFGQGDPRRKLIQLLIDQAERDAPLAMSPGEQIVDLTHVEDVVEAFVVAAGRIMAAEAAIHSRYLVSGERYRVRDLAPIVAQATGRPVAVEFGGRPYRPREVMEPIAPGPEDRLPGWHPTRTLADYVSRLAR